MKLFVFVYVKKSQIDAFLFHQDQPDKFQEIVKKIF